MTESLRDESKLKAIISDMRQVVNMRRNTNGHETVSIEPGLTITTTGLQTPNWSMLQTRLEGRNTTVTDRHIFVTPRGLPIWSTAQRVTEGTDWHDQRTYKAFLNQLDGDIDPNFPLLSHEGSELGGLRLARASLLGGEISLANFVIKSDIIDTVTGPALATTVSIGGWMVPESTG